VAKPDQPTRLAGKDNRYNKRPYVNTGISSGEQELEKTLKLDIDGPADENLGGQQNTRREEQ